MADVIGSNNEKGFSLIELLVALIFTLFLMAGLATIFKASMSSFYTSGENISNLRRNRSSIDLLGEDINMAGMYLTDMAVAPLTVPKMPPFYILPNAAISNPGNDAQDPKTTDELYFYIDEPMPFEGILGSGGTQKTAADMVLSGAVMNAATNNSYTVDCLSNEYAKQVANRINVDNERLIAIFKDNWEAIEVASPSASGRNVTFNAGVTPNAGIMGSGAQGLPSRVSHIPDTGVVFVKPAQMVRYRLEMLQLDPNKPNGIPCLVRDQGVYAYDGSDFKPSESADSRQIITENVSGFKVYLSVNGGEEWAGLGKTDSGFSAGWDRGIRGQIDAQLSKVGRSGHQITRGDEHWFRSVPTLVRVDLTTRTSMQRAEFSATQDTLAYKELTQTLIFVPRHFGLPLK